MFSHVEIIREATLKWMKKIAGHDKNISLMHGVIKLMHTCGM